MTVLCPAKVNLSLAVGPPDARGYHPLRTVFQAVGLFDELVINPSSHAAFSCDWPDMPSENTVTKAMRLTEELLGMLPVSVHLTKRIPAQAGLGGGSSDAAGYLRALPRLVQGAFPHDFVRDVALAVGADVPFFLVGGRAFGEGYGERLTPLPDEPRRWLVLAKPDGVGCDTPAAYRRLDAAPREWRTDPPEGYNDFERVAPCESLDLIERLKSLGAETAMLCGSGSAVFGAFEEPSLAEGAASRLVNEGGSWVEVAPTLTRAESLVIRD